MKATEIQQLKKAATLSGEPIDQLIAGRLGIFGMYFGHKVCPKKKAEHGRAVRQARLLTN